MVTIVVLLWGLVNFLICAAVLKDGKEVTVLNPAQVCAFDCSLTSFWLLASSPCLSCLASDHIRSVDQSGQPHFAPVLQ